VEPIQSRFKQGSDRNVGRGFLESEKSKGLSESEVEQEKRMSVEIDPEAQRSSFTTKGLQSVMSDVDRYVKNIIEKTMGADQTKRVSLKSSVASSHVPASEVGEA